MAVVFGISSKGKPTVIYRNFEYVKERDNHCGTTSWRCKRYQSMQCKARLITSGNRIVSDRQPDHTHSGNVATALGRKAVGEMKTKMSDMNATSSTSQASVVATLDNDVLMALPKRKTLARTLQRARLKAATAAAGGTPLPPVPSDLLFAIPTAFMDMVLYDSGPGDDRVIMMGCAELLDGLARAELWLADGTFKVVPTVFFQLYSIHFDFGSGIHPAAIYCLLTNKTSNTYNRVLGELQRQVPQAHPRTVLVDFEKAAMSAFSGTYPDATVTGCYFHLCQSVIRKVNEIGLKTEYETNDEVRTYVRCLPALAFVPPEDVEEAFELLSETQPTTVDHMDELTSFFEHTYIRGRRRRGRAAAYGPAAFPVESRNQHAAGSDGIARSTNSVEGWHHGLQSLFQCHHPTVWTFVSGVQRDIQRQKALFLQATTGVSHPSAKKYRALNDRVARAVGAYGRAEVLVYLRSIAYLSHA